LPFKAAGVPEQGYKERITELTGQASQARQDRDVDRWMAAAQGFFAMGAGGSRFAMQNMAEGLGVGTKQLQAAEKEYRVGEKARLDSIGVLKQAQRAEEAGSPERSSSAPMRNIKSFNRRNAMQNADPPNICSILLQQEGTLATKEMQAQQTKDAMLARISAAQGQNNYVNMLREQGLAETKRRNEEAERQKYATFQLAAKKGHRLNQKGGPLDTALGDLEIVQSKLAAKGKSKDSELLAQEAELETRIGKHNDTIANESAAEASRMINAGSKFKYVGVQ
jgi:hypothetical protein